MLWFIQRVQLITVRKACWEEREAANHTASTVGSGDGAEFGFPSHSAQDPSMERYYSMAG